MQDIYMGSMEDNKYLRDPPRAAMQTSQIRLRKSPFRGWESIREKGATCTCPVIIHP